MKTVQLQSIFKYEGKLVEVVAISEGQKVVWFREIGAQPCKECGRVHEYDAVESSTLFQDNAEPVKTLEL